MFSFTPKENTKVPRDNDEERLRQFPVSLLETGPLYFVNFEEQVCVVFSEPVCDGLGILTALAWAACAARTQGRPFPGLV